MGSQICTKLRILLPSLSQGTGGADRGHGADLIYWEWAAGRVFNAGTTNYTGALAVDLGIQSLTGNALHHMRVTVSGMSPGRNGGRRMLARAPTAPWPVLNRHAREHVTLCLRVPDRGAGTSLPASGSL